MTTATFMRAATVGVIAAGLSLLHAAVAVGQGGRVPPAVPRVPVLPPDSMATTELAGMADHAMRGPMNENMKKHMKLTPVRPPTHDDTLRATRLAAELRDAIAKYRDTAIAITDGYTPFLPDLKTQTVYHYTNNRRALLAILHFEPTKPTSLLYVRGPDGRLRLTGAMYTLGKRASLARLDARVPLSIARWHQHVNWCLPKRGAQGRWSERKDGAPLFGPESPIATKAECRAVDGDFHDTVFGWMLHVNVFEGRDLGAIFSDEHGHP